MVSFHLLLVVVVFLTFLLKQDIADLQRENALMEQIVDFPILGAKKIAVKMLEWTNRIKMEM